MNDGGFRQGVAKARSVLHCGSPERSVLHCGSPERSGTAIPCGSPERSVLHCESGAARQSAQIPCGSPDLVSVRREVLGFAGAGGASDFRGRPRFFAAGAGGRDRAATVVPAFETTDVETTDGGLDFRVMRRFLGVEAPEQPERARGMSDKSHREGPGRSHSSRVPRCTITQTTATTNNTTLGKM